MSKKPRVTSDRLSREVKELMEEHTNYAHCRDEELSFEDYKRKFEIEIRLKKLGYYTDGYGFYRDYLDLVK